MKKQKLLLLAFIDNIHIYNFVKNALSFSDYDITLYSMDGPVDKVNPRFIEYYRSIGITIVDGPSLSEGRVKYSYQAYRRIRKLGTFDIVHLHYVSHYIAPVVLLLKNRFKRIVLSFWGSDVKRLNWVSQLLIKPLIKNCDRISCANLDMSKAFSKTFDPDGKYCNKLAVFGWGFMYLNSIVDIVEEKSLDRNSIKRRFGSMHYSI